MKIKILLLFIINTVICMAQSSQTPASVESTYFNFWMGNWAATWKNSDGSVGSGENNIRYILDGKVIEEKFRVLEGQNKGFIGQSWSVYNQQQNIWQQTWVDNQGAYLDFVGEFTKDKRIFKRTFTGANGQTVMQRMVFYNISDNQFDWDWETSTDNGDNWKLNWRIHYIRMPDAK